MNVLIFNLSIWLYFLTICSVIMILLINKPYFWPISIFIFEYVH